jgi:hypothetical protein
MSDAVQSTYNKFPNAYNAGDIADFQTATDGITDGQMKAGGVANATYGVGSIGFGLGVMVDPDVDSYVAAIPTSSAEALKCYGVTVRDSNVAGSGAGGYPTGWEMNLLRRGVIAVPCTTACKLGEQAYLRYTVGSGGQPVGTWSNASDTGKNVAIPGCKFAQTSTTVTAAGNIVKLQVDLFGQGAQGATGATGPTGATGATGATGGG